MDATTKTAELQEHAMSRTPVELARLRTDVIIACARLIDRVPSLPEWTLEALASRLSADFALARKLAERRQGEHEKTS